MPNVMDLSILLLKLPSSPGLFIYVDQSRCDGPIEILESQFRGRVLKGTEHGMLDTLMHS